MRRDLKIARVALSLKGEGEEFPGGPGELGRGASVGSAGGVRAQAPLAVREPVEHVIHGDRRVDHYAWMKDKKDPRVRAYLEAENAYADAEMKETEGFQEKLYQEMLGRILQTDLSVPYSLRGYSYYTRTEEGKQYGIYCREREPRPATGDQRPEGESSQFSVESSQFQRIENQERSPQGLKPVESQSLMSDLKVRPPKEEHKEEEVLLDLNAMAVGHSFMGLGIFEVSEDNRWLAYATDTTGFRQYVLEVKDLRSGELLAFRAERVTSAAWAADSRTLFYVTEDEVTKRSDRLWRHGFGGEVASGEWRVASGEQEKDNAETQSAQRGRGEERRPATGDQLSEGESSQFTVGGSRLGKEESSKFKVQEFKENQERNPQGLKPVESQSLMSDLKVRPPNEEKDELIYEERDERFRIDVEKSRNGAYLFLVCNSHTTSEVRFLRADMPMGAFQLVAEREDEHEYYLEHHPGIGVGGVGEKKTQEHSQEWLCHEEMAEPKSRLEAGATKVGATGENTGQVGGVFFIRTNSGGRTYRLVTAPVENPGRARWHEVIANRPGVMLAGLEVFRTHLVLTEREDGLPHLRIVDLTREAPSALEASRRIEFAEPAYNATMGNNPEFDTSFVRYQYESMVTPRSVIDYFVGTGAWILRKQQPVLGDFDSGNYVSERLHAKAADGTLIPISVVWRKKEGEFNAEVTEGRTQRAQRSESSPLLLYGYGSYGLAIPVTFSSNRLSLLDRGMVYAIAHVRGGGELGKPWHDAGRMHQKMNTFTDFISCAEYLMAKRYTSPSQLVIEGGSAGGLLMGAVANLRPELFHAVVSHVPFVDVLNTMLDASLPLTVGEYEEWGNPQVAEDYFYMKRYCPYTNVERKSYPRMLVKTAWNDSQVMYWEAAKYVAKLRAMKTDGNVLLLKTNMGAGHGGASGRYDFLREVALDYAFVLRGLGISE
jgi:protease II